MKINNNESQFYNNLQIHNSKHKIKAKRMQNKDYLFLK